jgi:hypothetical protein
MSALGQKQTFAVHPAPLEALRNSKNFRAMLAT